MILRASSLLLALSALPLLANAQVQNPMAEDLITFGGQMHVLGEACSEVSAQDLNLAKSTQKSMAIDSMGISESQFQQWYSKGQQEASAQWKAMSATERQQACSEIADLGSVMGQLTHP